ncbi:MAG TPA: DUF748 domain-containing protein, partial [Verrucomicrobiae bacterium]|nr:DUF748 domain-containing protein [Verrucomicrobiae bacterium]
GAIIITNSTIYFSDLSLKPNVNLVLRSVNGSVSDLGSEKLQHAIVNLNAKMDGTGPVSITGTINPLNGALTNDLKISVKDVDLTPTSPYAGEFAGYGIAEGKLNLDLSYHLVGKKLEAKNIITLDQFTFGDKVNSPQATHLPVRLAVAILKDREGKIVLDVPIEGSIDDPKFRIGKVVTRAIENILEKVATSPFSLLGAAFGGSEALGWQDFAAGSAELTDVDKAKLDSLAKALNARPALKLQIAGSIDPEGDREGLERAALDREIRTRLWKKLRRSDQAKTSAAQIVPTLANRTHYIQKMLAEAYKAGKITPELIAANTNLAAYAAQAANRLPSSKQKTGGQLLMVHTAANTASASAAKPSSKLVPPPDASEALLLATFPVSPDDLAALAAARAQTVQTYLLQDGKVDAARIFLTASGAENLRQGGSRTYLEFR